MKKNGSRINIESALIICKKADGIIKIRRNRSLGLIAAAIQ